jgi:hypothetical protein
VEKSDPLDSNLGTPPITFKHFSEATLPQHSVTVDDNVKLSYCKGVIRFWMAFWEIFYCASEKSAFRVTVVEEFLNMLEYTMMKNDKHDI